MKLFLAAIITCIELPALAQDDPYLVSPDGTYLGKLNSNRYDADSVANP